MSKSQLPPSNFRRRPAASAEPEAEPAELPATGPKARAPQANAAPIAPHVGPMLDPAALMAELDALSPEDFAAMLGVGSPHLPEPGDQVTGTVVRVERDTVFVDVASKAEGVLDRSELDEDVSVGDTITAYVLDAGERGIRLARRLSGQASWDAIEQAREAGLPVTGKVESRNAGGFSVRIGSTSAFCPVSMIDRMTGPDLDAYVGRTMTFQVMEVRGRDVVVSHRAVAEEQAEASAEALWKTIAPDQVLDGTVTGVREFGVFVDVGGVRGLVPRRELDWDPEAGAPAPGTPVKVRVLDVDHDTRKITLSLRDPAFTPWSRVDSEFTVGQVVVGKVCRLADFGAFVTLAPGLDGMVHVSNLSNARINHPKEVLSVGQEVRVRILSVDHERQRLELGLKQADDDWVAERTGSTAKPTTGGLGTMADLFKNMKLDR